MLEKLKTKSFYLKLARDAVILFVMVYLISLYQSRNTPEAPPVLHEQLITGEMIFLDGMTDKAPVLIYFWGSWCPICTVTSDTVTSLAKDYTVLTVALSSGSNQEVQQYLQDKGYKFPVINDSDGIISNKWGVQGTPTIFIINSKGKIESVTVGYTSYLGLRFRLWLSS